LLIVAVFVIGGSIAGGYVLAQQQGNEQPATSSAAIPPLGAGAASSKSKEPADPTSVDTKAVTTDDVATPAQPLVAPDASEVVPDPVPELNAQALELAKNTGFDILVDPNGAAVTLDGQRIGIAPLRVRNLLAGVHQVDIEGPEGYFGQHQEFELAAGQAVVLRLSLDSLGDEKSTSSLASEDDSQGASKNNTKKPATVTKKSTHREHSKSNRNRRTSDRSSKSNRSAPSASEERSLASAEKVSMGTLMLGAKPPCEIEIDGKKTGLSTPQRAMQLPEGTHRVVLVNSKLKIRKAFKVRIKSGRTTRAIQDLTKKL